MRAIIKGPEPVSLTAHRQTSYADYDNYAPKDDLRHCLVAEQRGLCCYCMGRIRIGPAAMKIEHWRCQTRHSAKQLRYRNLLGACLGGHGQPTHLQHCDTSKRDRDLEWNPADPAHYIESRVWYEPNGSIHADDAVFDGQINDVLNLNLPLLKNNRKGVYDAVLQWSKNQKKRQAARVRRERLERARSRHDAAVGELAPYAQVAISLLDEKLARMAT